jgi:hypothetical protein
MRWLMKRWWFWAGTGFMLVAVVAGYLLIPVGEGRISQAACDRIQIGMTHEQVCELLHEKHVLNVILLRDFWGDDDGNSIEVNFDGEQIHGTEPIGVIRKEFRANQVSFYERMKRRIERRIKALWP